MVGETQPITVTVTAEGGRMDSQRAVSLGLIVTELVLNAIKYAFPKEKAGAHIQVSYETAGSDWKLTVSDNGVGKIANDLPTVGLGTAIVEALVKQLEAKVEIISDTNGTSVSVTRATFISRVPRAA
jgi:two-component sensor histidine kinase